MKSKLQVAGAVLGMVVALAACSTNSSSSSTTTTTTSTTTAPVGTTSTTAKKPAQSITITPDTGLANDQVVSITGTGFPDEQLGVTECANKGAQTGAGDCNLGGIKVIKATAAGTVSTQYQVLLGPFGANHIVCTNAPGCLVSVAQAGVANPNAVATELIHFK
ncbi:MAG: neocarzinostatin apoprotein domain-containing protein [Acidimicrobiales bacterium]